MSSNPYSKYLDYVTVYYGGHKGFQALNGTPISWRDDFSPTELTELSTNPLAAKLAALLDAMEIPHA